MTVLASGDVRRFYEALGVELPAWAQREAPARCFATPDAHNNEDRTPSTSVNLESGAWYCHGCGAHGGAYDAALAHGHTPRSAIDLMIAHGLTDRRAPTADPHARPRKPVQLLGDDRLAPSPPEVAQRGWFTIAERDIGWWQQTLARRPALLESLTRERGWSYRTMRELELGLDQLCQRITIPIRDDDQRLQGLLRYDPSPTRRGPKMRAAPGTRLGLIPHPAQETNERIVLVEGPPDMIAARSHGLRAIAVPSTSAWQPEWAPLLAGRDVTVIMDSDRPGRRAAQRIAADLRTLATVRVVDLAPDHDDGYDLTDALLDRGHDLIEARVLGRSEPERGSRRDAGDRGMER